MKKKLALVSKLLMTITLSLSGADTDNAYILRNMLRIMTWNIRREGDEQKPERLWSERLNLVTSILKQSHPDIIGLQEPTKKQIDDLLEQKELNHLEAFGEGRGSSWWGLGTDEHNPILYNKEKFTLIESGTFPINRLEGIYKYMPWQTGWLPRICTWGKFKINDANKEFYLYNTHFDHMYTTAQLNCAHTLLQRIKEQNKDNLPVIVTGDFNTEFSGDLKELLSDFVHTKDSATTQSGPHETATGWDNASPKWIDHILITNGTSVVGNHTVIDHDENSIYPSDHRPVCADIALIQ